MTAECDRSAESDRTAEGERTAENDMAGHYKLRQDKIEQHSRRGCAVQDYRAGQVSLVNENNKSQCK